MDPKIAEVIANLTEVLSGADDEELALLEERLVETLEEIAEIRDVDSARSLAQAIDQVRAESKQRAELARQREEEIKSIMSRVHLQNEDETENPDGDDSPDATKDSSAEAGTSDAPEDDEKKTEAGHRSLPKISDIARRKTQAAAASPRQRPASAPDRRSGTTTVTAAADVPGLTAGTEITDRSTLRKAIIDRWQAMSGSRTSGRVPVARIEMNYPDERILKAGDDERNEEKLHRLLSPQALTASGGICAPPAGFYDTMTLAVGGRPLRDSLPVFGAERGGIRFIRSSSISDIVQTGAAGSAIGVTTEAEDVGAATKPCQTITCNAVQEVVVQAISRCLQFGNFNARTHPEYVAHLTDLTIAAHARVAEQELWQAICDGSTAVTQPDQLSAWRDLYETVARATAQSRSRHRAALDQVYRLVVPAWVVPYLSADLVRQLPGDQTVFGVGRARFEDALANIGVRVTWTYEGGIGVTQIYGAETGSLLNNWFPTVRALLFAEGTWLFLDGGTLDLGVVRDSTLNQTNDFQLFAETFEGAARIGPESFCLTMDLCNTGITAGQDDALACAS